MHWSPAKALQSSLVPQNAAHFCGATWMHERVMWYPVGFVWPRSPGVASIRCAVIVCTTHPMEGLLKDGLLQLLQYFHNPELVGSLLLLYVIVSGRPSRSGAIALGGIFCEAASNSRRRRRGLAIAKETHFDVVLYNIPYSRSALLHMV